MEAAPGSTKSGHRAATNAVPLEVPNVVCPGMPCSTGVTMPRGSIGPQAVGMAEQALRDEAIAPSPEHTALQARLQARVMEAERAAERALRVMEELPMTTIEAPRAPRMASAVGVQTAHGSTGQQLRAYCAGAAAPPILTSTLGPS